MVLCCDCGNRLALESTFNCQSRNCLSFTLLRLPRFARNDKKEFALTNPGAPDGIC
jgi:hypothetical protein